MAETIIYWIPAFAGMTNSVEHLAKVLPWFQGFLSGILANIAILAIAFCRDIYFGFKHFATPDKFVFNFLPSLFMVEYYAEN